MKLLAKLSSHFTHVQTVTSPASATTTATSTPNHMAQLAIEGAESPDSTYYLKWIPWNTDRIPIVMQSKNGPCPLIAIMNVLLLKERIRMPNMLEQITADQLLTYLGERLMDCVPDNNNDEHILLNLEQNINDAIEMLPRLKYGLDVNIRFTGITDFEFTSECVIFDLLRIPLYHGWLIDPSLVELKAAIGNQSYNQLVDRIITYQISASASASGGSGPEGSTTTTSTTAETTTTATNDDFDKQDDLAKILMAEEFLERTASQLTSFGVQELKSRINDNEIGVLFRNNHFSTVFKRDGELYTLVTDHGYLTEDNIIWEILDSIEGAGRFFDANFQPCDSSNRQVLEFNAIDERQQQLEKDFLIALSLEEEETSR